MKKFKKSTAIALSIVFGILLVIGFLFSFVPMTVGSKTFVSLSGAINISSDISGGLYGEYDIKTKNPSKTDLVESMAIIKDVFEENGYKNANVYAVGKSKIRVEVGYPKGDSTYTSVYAQLAEVAAGAFSLRSTQELSDSSIVLEGSKHVEEVNVYTYNDTKTMSVKFNDDGQEVYKKLCTASSTIYLVLGDYSQSISVSGATDYTQLSLSNDDWDNLIALEQKIKLGCMKIELNSGTAVINTMSASLSAGESSSFNSKLVNAAKFINHKQFTVTNAANNQNGVLSLTLSGNASSVTSDLANYLSADVAAGFESSAYVIAFASFFAIVVLGLAVFAAKFGLYAILMLATLLLNSYAFLGIMCLVPSIEFGLSTIAALVMGTAIIYAYAFAFASKVKSEYNLGKSLNASLESAYKKQLPTTLMSNIMLFFASLIMFAFSFGELSSVAIVFTTCTALSLITNLLIVPLFIKICISFNGFGRKLFMLKKRSGILDSSDETELAKEAE